MNENVKNAIEESIEHDCTARCVIATDGQQSDVVDTLREAGLEGCTTLDGNVWDAWGINSDGDDWLIEITFSPATDPLKRMGLK